MIGWVNTSAWLEQIEVFIVAKLITSIYIGAKECQEDTTAPQCSLLWPETSLTHTHTHMLLLLILVDCKQLQQSQSTSLTVVS